MPRVWASPGAQEEMPAPSRQGRRPGDAAARCQDAENSSYHSAFLSLLPVPMAQLVGARSSQPRRQGVEGRAGAGGQPRVGTVQQAVTALVLEAVIHALQVQVPHHVWGAARAVAPRLLFGGRAPAACGGSREQRGRQWGARAQAPAHSGPRPSHLRRVQQGALGAADTAAAWSLSSTLQQPGCTPSAGTAAAAAACQLLLSPPCFLSALFGAAGWVESPAAPSLPPSLPSPRPQPPSCSLAVNLQRLPSQGMCFSPGSFSPSLLLPLAACDSAHRAFLSRGQRTSGLLWPGSDPRSILPSSGPRTQKDVGPEGTSRGVV